MEGFGKRYGGHERREYLGPCEGLIIGIVGNCSLDFMSEGLDAEGTLSVWGNPRVLNPYGIVNFVKKSKVK